MRTIERADGNCDIEELRTDEEGKIKPQFQFGKDVDQVIPIEPRSASQRFFASVKHLALRLQHRKSWTQA